MFHIVLVAPEIPPNTGNIIRLCANAGCFLHLVEPLGFDLEDSKLRRAGLDYREWVNVEVHRDYFEFAASHASSHAFMFSRRHAKLYSETHFCSGEIFVFGSETSGLPESVRTSVPQERRLKVPMIPGYRSINLSNTVAIVVYEAWRQIGFRLN